MLTKLHQPWWGGHADAPRERIGGRLYVAVKGAMRTRVVLATNWVGSCKVRTPSKVVAVTEVVGRVDKVMAYGILITGAVAGSEQFACCLVAKGGERRREIRDGWWSGILPILESAGLSKKQGF